MAGPTRDEIAALTTEVRELARHVGTLSALLHGASSAPPRGEAVEVALARAARLAALRGKAENLGREQQA